MLTSCLINMMELFHASLISCCYVKLHAVIILACCDVVMLLCSHHVLVMFLCCHDALLSCHVAKFSCYDAIVMKHCPFVMLTYFHVVVLL